MLEPNLIENDNIPESSSREIIKNPEENKENKEENNNKEKGKENLSKEEDNNKFIIESNYLKIVECTAMVLGPEKIFQNCYVCPICNPKKNNYICKYCYNKCHQKCRDITKIKKKEEDYRGRKNFACYCGNKLKHETPEIKKKEKRVCDLIVLDQSLKVGSFFCETHQISICCVCSVECHKKCIIKKHNNRIGESNKKRECLCDGENHTTYNEIAFIFPLDEYRKVSGVSVWPIQILNILFNQKKLENISNLFKSMINNEEISEEQKKEFFPLLELFSKTFNRKFKTPYYVEEIIDTFEYKNLIEYIKNLEINSTLMVNLKIKLVFILLFVHLKNDFKITKSLISNDFLCSNLLERIQYRKILMKNSIFNKQLNEKYKLKELIQNDSALKEIILNDVCNLMAIGIDYMSIEENEEDFEICLKIICFWVKKMLFSKEDLIKLINSIYIFFNKFIGHINSGKSNIFLLIDLFSGLSELFLMISVAYNDIIVMEYLDKYKNTSNINNIELKDNFIHVTSKHGTKLFEMIMKSCELMKKHYDLLNKYEDILSNKNTKLFKDKMKMEKLNNSKYTAVEIKLPNEGGLFFDKIINLFAESLGIFSLADNIYFKQIDFLTKDDIIDYYNFCELIESDKSETMPKKEMNSINEIINNMKIEIENKLFFLFTTSYSNNINNIVNELKDLLINFSTQINDIMLDKNEKNEEKNEMSYDKYKKIKREYIKNDKAEDDPEKIEKIRKLNKYLSKISYKNKKIFPFLISDTFPQKSKDLVDILIISNLDEILTKILVYFSNRKYPNLLTYELLEIIFSYLSLYFFSKRGIKYLLIGKNLVRINKIFNRYDIKPKNKNINEAYGKTEENNIKFINLTLDFCCAFFKGMKLFDGNIKNHKILERFRKNMLSHLGLFNSQIRNENINTFIFQFKKIIDIFYFLSDDFEFECLEQIKKQCVFIFNQNKLNIFDNKSLSNTYNNGQEIPDNLLTLKSNRSDNNIININNNNDINYSFKNKETNKNLISLYFAFFRLFGVNTFYMFINDENDSVMKMLYNFTDLNLLKKYFTNNYFEIKQKLILFQYLRSVYFIDHLEPYNILSKKNNLTTIEFNVLIKCNAIVDEKFEKCLNLKQGLSLPAKLVNDLMDKYKKINELELIVNIYLNEIKAFPRQILNCNVGDCILYYKNLLFDIKFLSNYFYSQKNIWSKFNLIFYQLCLEFIPKIEIFKNVYEILKQENIENNFNIEEDLYLNTLDQIEGEEDNENKNKNIGKNNDEWNKVKLKAYKTIQKLKSISFDIYNTKELYSYLNEFIDSILNFSNLSHIYDLQNYLRIYDETAEANFTPFCLLETLDYEYFYEEDKQEKDEEIKKDINLYKLKYIKDSFFENFIDVNNTNFMEIINKIESDNSLVDYTKEYVELFKSFITSKEGNKFRLLNIFICILAKMLFYNSEKLQDKFEDFINDEYFFPNMNILLNMYLVLVFSLTKNIYAYKFLIGINNLSKLIIQLLQSLGEGFNTKYHDNIFKLQKDVPLIDKDDDDFDKNEEIISSSDETEKSTSNQDINNTNENIEEKDKFPQAKMMVQIPDIDISSSIYDSLIINLKYALTAVGMKNLIEGELPYDKLIITITNIFDFLIEYIESTEGNDEIIKNCLKNLFFGIKCKKNEYDKTNMELLLEVKCIDLLFVKIYTNENNKEQYYLRKKIICYIKNKFANLLVYYLLTGNKKYMVEKLILNNCSPFDLFSEIIYNFKQLLNNLEQKNPNLTEKLSKALKNSEINTYADLLIDYFGFEEDFRNMIEFPVIIQYYILIKIFEEFYNHKEIKSHFEGLNENMEEMNNLDDYNIRSKFSLCVYLFLEKIILKVEIKLDNDDSEDDLDETEQNKIKIANLVLKNIKDEPFINKIKLLNKKGKTNNLMEEENDNEENSYSKENTKNIKTAFFLRPYLTFTLSETTKNKFIRDVDRTNASQKYVSLVQFSDYCLFEMVVNRHLIGDSEIKNRLANINYFLIEFINYIVIFINNCFVIYHFYKSPYLPIENYDIFDEKEKDILHIDNIIISLAQAAILAFFLIVWIMFEFFNDIQFNIMKLYNKNFLMKKEGESNNISQNVIDYFQDKDNVSSYQFYNEINKDVSKWKLVYVGFFEVFLFNKEINMFLLTIIFNILFLLLRNYLFLVIEILFIVNIVPTLSDILKAMRIKYLHIILVLLLDFLIVYVFMWLGFFFFNNFFVYDEILESSSGSLISEGFCYSSVQCYLYYISLGTRSGGGIGDSISAVSYQKDFRMFIARFFNDMLFFIIVNLVLGNVFLGIIIDTFGELRDAQLENENDMKNICFICQLSSDACLTRNIDFDKHVNEVHNIWNYVYFLAYLHLNNPNNFNRVENSVWEKLEKQDYSWIPIDTNSEDD